MKKQLISIIVAIRNEEKYITQCIDSLLNQTEEDLEVIVIDGMSDDNTLKIIKNYQKKNPKKVRFFKNTAKRVAEGRNIGYNNAKGKYIGFIDGHSFAKKNWVETLIKTIEKSSEKVCGVGSIHLNAGKDKFSEATTIVMNSLIGGGGTSYRKTNKIKQVQTAYAVIYKKVALNSIKNKKNEYYNPYFIKGQDAEMNIRLNKKGWILLRNPKAITYYYKRPNLKGFWKQMVNAGFWRVKITKKHPDTIWKNKFLFAPLIFFLGIIVLAIIKQTRIISLGLISIYLLTIILFTLIYFIKKRDKYYFINAIMYLIIHIGYSYGILKGFFNKSIRIEDRVKQ